MNEEDTGRILAELAAIRKEGADRGRRVDGNLKLITENAKVMGDRLAVVEERIAQTEHALQRSNSGFHKSFRGASETDAKLQSDLAAVVLAVQELGARQAEASKQQTSALGSLIVGTVQGMAPDKRAMLGDAALKFFIAIALILSALASYLQSKGH